jgi:tetratricopeptide (TPR) repeat protein
MTTERCKDWRDSLSLWKDNVEKHPEAPVAYFYLGQEYDTRFEESLDPKEKNLYRDSAYYYFVQAIYHKPDYTNALICLGELQRSIGQADEAKISYFRALAINDKNETVYLGLGVVYSIKRQFDSAAWAFQTALKLKPVYAEAHSNYANYLDIIGQTDQSLAEYATAIAQNPEATIPYQNRARIYMVEKKQYDPAIADYTRVIQLKPDNGEAYYMRSRCYALKGDKAHAIADADKAVELKYPKVDPAYLQEIKR